MDIYETRFLMRLIDEIPSRPSFLRDRYFPGDGARGTFNTQEVLVEIKDHDRRLAPIVARNVGDVVMSRPGESMRSYKPPRVAPARMLSLDEIQERGFGEALYTDLSPEARANQYNMRDMQELSDATTRREEAMASEVLRTNKCVLKGLADRNDTPVTDVIQFYEGENQATATVSKSWSDPTANIISDLGKMVLKLQRLGLPAEDLIVAGDVADAILRNDEVYKMLDNRRYELGMVVPRLEAPGAAVVAVLNINGHQINIISYVETYTGDDGKDTPYMPNGSVVLTAPGCGSTYYGAVTQLESDRQYHTYVGSRIPKVIVDDENDSRKLRVSSRPILIPNNVDPYVSANVIF